MALDAKDLQLINASIDGELAESAETELTTLLERNAEARAVHADLAKLAETLGGVEDVAPPPQLKHAILAALPAATSSRTAGQRSGEGFWSNLLASSPLRYAGAFGFGVLVALVFASSDMNSRHAFDDVTRLVGTLSRPGDEELIDAESEMILSSSELAGKVQSHRDGSIMIIDFNLVSSRPLEIVARFTQGDIWFNGFAQLDSAGTRVSAGPGEVRLQMVGDRRYAVYLHNASGEATTVSLSIYSDGELLHEGQLSFSEDR
jgi:hypothetical protein